MKRIFPRDSSVGIATRRDTDGPGIEFRLGGVAFSAPVHTDPGAHPASYTMGTGSLSQSYSGGSVALNTHSHLASWLKKEYSNTSTLVFMLGYGVNFACLRM